MLLASPGNERGSTPTKISKRNDIDDVYSDSCLVVEQKRYFVAVHGIPLKLTKTEFQIVSCLTSNINRITSLEDLWAAAWDRDKPLNRKRIQVMMSRVRRKL